LLRKPFNFLTLHRLIRRQERLYRRAEQYDAGSLEEEIDAVRHRFVALMEQKHLSLDTFLVNPDLCLATNARLLKRILLILVSNAAQHTRAGETISLEATNDGSGITLLLSVALGHRRDRHGEIGRGLAMAIQLVEAQGGKVWEDAQEGRYTVAVLLPAFH